MIVLSEIFFSNLSRRSKISTASLITLIILSNLASFANAQTVTDTMDQIWNYQDSGYTQAVLWDIDFINGTHGWVVGQSVMGLGDGIILATTDGGGTWNTQLSDISQCLTKSQ